MAAVTTSSCLSQSNDTCLPRNRPKPKINSKEKKKNKTKLGALRVYWPTDTLSILSKNEYPASVIIGWRNYDNDIVVVTTLPFLDLALVERLLTKDVLLKSYHLPPKQLYSICGVNKLSVLGTVNCTKESILENSSFKNVNNTTYGTGNRRQSILFQPHQSLFNVSYNKSLKYPIIEHSPNSGDHPLFENTPSHAGFPYSYVQMIMFDPPFSSRLQYFTLIPPSLELPEKTSFTVISEQLEKTLVDQEREAQELCEKIKYHAEYDQEELDQHLKVLNNCIAQMNTCRDLGTELRKQASEIFPKLKSNRITRRLSISELALESAKQVQGRIAQMVTSFKNKLMPLVLYAFIYFILFFRLLAEGILRTIEWRPAPSWHALKELSATAQQIDLRLQQFCYSPVQYLRIRRQSQDWTCNYASFNVEYVLFYNNIWLIINDVIIGITLSKLILEFRSAIYQYLCYAIENPLTHDFEKTILWLMDWPGGLKLNNELATFFGGLFIWVIHFWRFLLEYLRPIFPVMILIVAYSGFGGATLLLSVVSDIVSFITLHVYAFYLASGRIYHWQLTVLRSLFHLFRGKKRNILRNRVDSCSYELDQLLMGTIFFTSLIFLLPTVVVFYLTFAACRLSIILVNTLLESCLACLNHFPLFAIMLYFKDYKRLPGGISFVLVNNNCNNHGKSSSSNGDSSNINKNHNNNNDKQFIYSKSENKKKDINYRNNNNHIDKKDDDEQQLQQENIFDKNSSEEMKSNNNNNKYDVMTSYVFLKPLALPFSTMFFQYRLLYSRIRFLYLSFPVILRLLSGQFVPIQRSQLYSLLYSKLPKERVSLSQLYQELVHEFLNYRHQ